MNWRRKSAPTRRGINPYGRFARLRPSNPRRVYSPAMPFPPTLVDFGHGSLVYGGGPATGGRPLLIVLADWADWPSIQLTHTPDYYERLAFGDPTPPLSTWDPVNPASMREYFRENSYGRFWFDRVAVIGPLDMGVRGDDPGARQRVAAILAKVVPVASDAIGALDANADHVIGPHELSVLLVENIKDAMPGNSSHVPVHFAYTQPTGTVDVTLALQVAGGWQKTPFYQLAHELSHASIGTKDMYRVDDDNDNDNDGLTLMSRYSFDSDDQYVVHLDMWHKMLLGWAEPRLFPLDRADSAEVWEGPDGAILLWDDAHRTNEYFLIERRRPDAPGQRFDADFDGDGVVIWRVKQPISDSVKALGAPDLKPGGSTVWAVGTQTPYLTWTDGTSTGKSVSVTRLGNGRVQVAWGDEIAHVSTSRHRLLFHGGNGSDGVGGLTHRGQFWGITIDGYLEWNSYNGRGGELGEPAAEQGWHPNSGNRVGRSWGSIRLAVGAGEGVILAVTDGGDLRWYCYSGRGEADESGGIGWDPNSGNIIGVGFQDFQHIFAIPSAGIQPSPIQLFGVTTEGVVHWYGYRGRGEEDLSGHHGWLDNSGNQIAWWTGTRSVHASGNVVFVINDDGTLHYYAYTGDGTADLTGGTGWAASSGNEIGHSWQGMQHVFGGVSDVGGFGHVVFGVDPDANLRWYRYTGSGDADPTGGVSWDPASQSVIGQGW